MHASVKTWVGQQVAEHGLAPLATLEVGSLDVNGSVRDLFSGSYTGVDFRDGPGVDVVMDAHDLRYADGVFPVVVSTEMLEHDSAPWRSMAEMGRVLRGGGHLLVTTRGNGFGVHEFPADYWRFMPAAGPVLLELADCEPVEVRTDPEVPGLFMHGIRR